MLVSFIFIKPYYDYNVYSIYEYLTARFGTVTKNAASAVFLVTRVLASGSRLYVAAIALVLVYELASGLRPTAAQTLGIYVVASQRGLTVLTAIYTTLGGIKAVIWTDFIQATIMMGSAVAALCMLFFAIPGGWSGITAHLSSTASTGPVFRQRPGPQTARLAEGQGDVRDGVHRVCDHRLDVRDDGHARHGSGHGAANAHRAGHPPLAAFADSFRAGGHSDFVGVSGDWRAAVSRIIKHGQTRASPRRRTSFFVITSSTSFRWECGGFCWRGFLPRRWVR